MIKIASLFSGIGGFELGLLNASKETNIPIQFVFSSEIDKYARQIYKNNFGVKSHDDITKINANDIPEFDLLTAGFPCQSFSIAGLRRGFQDIRGTLFFEIMRIVEAKRPRMLFLENVKGLLNHDQGKTFQTVLRSLDELGYDAEWQMFNSKNHGVPQNRERVFIIGHLRGSGTRSIFPITGSNQKNIGWNEKRFIDLQLDGAQCTSVSRTIQSRYYKGYSSRHGENSGIIQLNNSVHSNNRVYSDKELPPTLSCMGGGNRQPFIEVQSIQLRNKNMNGRRIKNHEEPSFTLDSSNSVGISINSTIRRLTPLECERLQGFPDGWTESISDTQRYKCLGNAVTVNVIQFLGKWILKSLEEYK